MSRFIKTQMSMTLSGTACVIIASLFGLQKGLAILLLCIGFRELPRAKDYYDSKQKEWTIASFAVGVSVCICGFLSLTNLI